MTTPAEERARRFADAVTRRDPDAAIAECDPEVEFVSVLAALEPTAFRGAAGIREYFKVVASAWKEWRVVLDRVEEAPDGRVAVAMTTHMRGRDSDAQLAQGIGHLWELRDGKLFRVTPSRDPAEPFRIAGLAV